mgnify:CR=1 FL=1
MKPPDAPLETDARARYLEHAINVLVKLRDSQAENMEAAASWIASTIEGGGLVYVAGSGHSHMLAEEVFYRAGGLAAIHPLLDSPLMLHDGARRSTALERLEGLAGVIVSHTDMSEHDLLIVASNSGRNSYPIELALAARERGCRSVGVTSLETAAHVTSRHSSGKLMADVVDLVLDNCVPYGDAVVEIEGHPSKVGPVSTVAGAALMNALVSRATEIMVAGGHQPDTLTSANVQERGGRLPDMAYWATRVRHL